MRISGRVELRAQHCGLVVLVAAEGLDLLARHTELVGQRLRCRRELCLTRRRLRKLERMGAHLRLKPNDLAGLARELLVRGLTALREFIKAAAVLLLRILKLRL